MIPTETELMESLGVGRETVRRALLKLAAEGYLHRSRGRGSIVCRNRPEDGVEKFISFTAEMLSRGYRPGALLLECALRFPPAEAQEALKLKAEEKVVYIKRLRTADGVPVAVEESFLKKEVIGDIKKNSLGGSFYHYLVYEKGIELGRISQEISSVLANAKTAALLEVEAGHPVLQLSRLIHTALENPFFWLTFLYRGDLYTVKSKLSPTR